MMVTITVRVNLCRILLNHSPELIPLLIHRQLRDRQSLSHYTPASLSSLQDFTHTQGHSQLSIFYPILEMR